MATDLADYTQAVNVIGGNVTISGTATVTISGTPAVSISGTPTVNIGTAPTITVTGSVSITGTATVSISGTPSVTIASGTVNIGGTPVVNVQQANGLTIFGPSLLPAGASGPMIAGWASDLNLTASFNATGELKLTITANGAAYSTALAGTTGPYAMLKVRPGETYHLEASFQPVTRTDSAQMATFGYAADGTTLTVNYATGGNVNCPVGQYTQIAFDWLVPEGTYFMRPFVYVARVNGTAGDVWLIGHCTVSKSGAFAMNAQQGALPINQPQIALPNLTFTASATSTQTTAAVPPGTHALILIPGGPLTQVSVFGGTTGSLYAPLDPRFLIGAVGELNLTGTQLLVVPVASNIDSTFSITGTNPGGASTMRVIAVLDTMATWVQNSVNTPIFSEDIPMFYNNTGVSAPVTGTAPSVTMAATTNRRLQVVAYSAELSQTGATADSGDLLTLTLSNIQAEHRLGVPAGAGNSQVISRGGLGYIDPATGNAAVVAIGSVGASVIASISVAVFLY